MGKEAQTIELSTDLGINYIPCCKIVLMFYNGLGYAIGRPIGSLEYSLCCTLCGKLITEL